VTSATVPGGKRNKAANAIKDRPQFIAGRGDIRMGAAEARLAQDRHYAFDV